MKTRYMKLGDKYGAQVWPERIRVTQGDSSKLYLPKHNASWSSEPDASTETLKLDKSELWPDELCITNGRQIKKYTLDKAPNATKRNTQGMLHELSQLKDENTKLRKLATELWQLAYDYMPYNRVLDSVREEMHELGIWW